MSTSLKDLLTHYPSEGELVWLGLRPARGAPMRALQEGELLSARGLDGDVTCTSGRGGGKRQVTLLQAEHLDVIAKLLGRPEVEPALLRRNLVVRGINVYALRSQRFYVGGALLEGSGTCDPCSKMETALGYGGYNALRGHGGITARVLTGATIRVGDAVRFAADAP